MWRYRFPDGASAQLLRNVHLGCVMFRLLSPYSFLLSHPFFQSYTPAFGISRDLKFKSVQGLA